MSISSLTNTDWHKMLPSSLSTAQADSSSGAAPMSYKDSVQLSDQTQQPQKQAASESGTVSISSESRKKSGPNSGKESVQVSSSTGRSLLLSGLNREEVAALYRSIDKLS